MSFSEPARSSDDGRLPGLWWLPVVMAVVRTPRLWVTALRQVARLAPRGWWHRWPPLPVPDQEYVRFRSQTMYGGDGRAPDPDDVLAYLNWCKSSRTAARGRTKI
jgi:hypothetical protein